MEKTKTNGASSSSNSSCRTTDVKSGSIVQRSIRNTDAVQEALRHLACVDLRELSKEAKVERCRATRDLGSCGRDVQYVLNSCGHAALCTECSQRCDICPICRTEIPNSGNRLRIRLYYECIEAGLIPHNCEVKPWIAEDDRQVIADVQRLYSFFDVAMGNNLISLICHYVTEVCMDERAVSNDPVIAFLLDEVVVKNWVKRTFKNILMELHGIYSLEIKDMGAKLSDLLKNSTQLSCISSVLEVLESSFRGTLSPQLQDVQQLQENILKLKQHVEVMVWCIRHKFLEGVKSRFTDISSWCSHVRERKSAAIQRAWPGIVEHSVECDGRGGSLFIEDALENLEIEQAYTLGVLDGFQISCLQKNPSLYFSSQIGGISGCYPFDDLHMAIDILFLRGRADLVLAKQGILIYYLFDRHWTISNTSWRDVIDDFAATFNITRHSLLESFTFFLLDDYTEAAFKEACRILPEICGPETHQKIPRVLLERQNPETALMVLRWTGHDSRLLQLSVNEIITALRIRVECALLSEAFVYQRAFWTKLKENNSKSGVAVASLGYLESKCRSWKDMMEALVTEFCCLCIRRNLVDRIIELPWNSDEEKYLHKCLLDSAADDPSSTVGSLLVVFYLQRHRYIEAYQVNIELQKLEIQLANKRSLDPEVLSRMTSQRHWRTELVEKALELLPAVQQQQIRAAQLSDSTVFSNRTAENTTNSDGFTNAASNTVGISVSAFPNSTLLNGNARYEVPKSSIKTSLCGLRGGTPPTGSGHGSSILQERLLQNIDRGLRIEANVSGGIKNSDASTAGWNEAGIIPSALFKGINRSSRRVSARSYYRGTGYNKISPEPETYGFLQQLQNRKSPNCIEIENSLTTTPVRNHLIDDLGPKSNFNASGKRTQLDQDHGTLKFDSLDDPMEINSTIKEGGYPVMNGIAKSSLRWRSDENSDEDGDQPLKTGKFSRKNLAMRTQWRSLKR